jgi:hypothetical protein
VAKPRTKLFVSYSHKNADTLARLQVHLQPLVRDSTLDLWDDTRIQAGDRWPEAIAAALAEAKIAILLVSADFLASKYINQYELPELLEAASHDGLVILPLHVSTSGFLRNKTLAPLQSINRPEEPLDLLPQAQQEVFLEKVAERVEQILGQQELRAQVDSMRGRAEEQQRQIDAQQAQINQLVTYMLSASIFRHLAGIALLYDYQFHPGPMTRELYFLRDIGFIRPTAGEFPAFETMRDGENLSRLITPTPIGWSCLKLRSGEVPRGEWVTNPVTRPNLRVDIAASIGVDA